MRRVVDFRLVVLLVFFFLYRFVNVGFNAMVIYHAYSIVHSAWGSALAVSVLILGSTVGLLVTGLYVLYSVRPQVLMLTLMMLREILLLNFVLFSPLTRELSLLLPVLLIYSTALWIERSILGGIAIENVPSIARGLNALNISSALGGLTVSSLLGVFLGAQTLAFTVLVLLHTALMVMIASLLLSGKLGFRVTVPKRGTLRDIFSERAVLLYAIMFILNIPISVLLSIAPTFGASVYALFYMTSEAMAIVSRIIFIILGDKISLSVKVLLLGTLLGYVLTLVAYIYNEPTALITSIIAINIALAASTVYIGNVLKHILASVIYNVNTILGASSLLGALYGSLTLLTPAPNIIFITTLLAITLTVPILHHKMEKIGKQTSL